MGEKSRKKIKGEWTSLQTGAWAEFFSSQLFEIEDLVYQTHLPMRVLVILGLRLVIAQA